MIAEVLATGDEIITGSVTDTNSAYISEKLEETGILVVRHCCAGDDMDTLVSLFKETGSRADIAVVTGGLGPTLDDITSEAAAKAAGVALFQDKAALKSIEDYFKPKKRTISESNFKQALLPEGAECIPNPAGTAPGFVQTIGKCRFFFLPGVPLEMYSMFSESVLPEIEQIHGNNRLFNRVKIISVFGLPESTVGERLHGITQDFPEIKPGLRAVFPEIHVKLYGRGKDSRYLDECIEQATERILKKIGKNVFSVDGNSMQAEVGKLLNEKKSTIAIAESCTGGLISHWLTNVPGSSTYFHFSGVTYSNQAKINVLGVTSETINEYGAVHEKTVKEMADGVRRITGATYGLATSGIAGPTGGTEDKPVGTVCIGIASPDSIKSFSYCFTFDSRIKNKEIFAMTALEILRRELLGITEN